MTDPDLLVTWILLRDNFIETAPTPADDVLNILRMFRELGKRYRKHYNQQGITNFRSHAQAGLDRFEAADSIANAMVENECIEKMDLSDVARFDNAVGNLTRYLYLGGFLAGIAGSPFSDPM